MKITTQGKIDSSAEGTMKFTGAIPIGDGAVVEMAVAIQVEESEITYVSIDDVDMTDRNFYEYRYDFIENLGPAILLAMAHDDQWLIWKADTTKISEDIEIFTAAIKEALELSMVTI